MPGEHRYPILADTSSLIAVANTDHWEALTGSLAFTTTNVCKHELKNHATDNAYPPEGSREYYLKRGSERVLDYLESAESASAVTIVPRPHGPDAGEESLKQDLAEHGDEYQIVSILDTAARLSIRRLITQHDHDVDVVGPPYLLYILLDNNRLSKAEFCDATAEMIRTEGWTGYEVVKAAWAGIPVDCADSLDEDYDDTLPPE